MAHILMAGINSGLCLELYKLILQEHCGIVCMYDQKEDICEMDVFVEH